MRAPVRICPRAALYHPGTRRPQWVGARGERALAAYEHFITTDEVELWARIDAAHGRFATLLREVGLDATVAGSRWSSGEVAQHIVTVLRRYTRRDLHGLDGLAPRAEDIATLNDAQLAALPPTSLDELLADLAAELDAARDLLPGHDLHERFPFHAGTTIDAAGGLANIVGELVVHGLDIARGAGRHYEIDQRDALLVLNALTQMAPGFLRAPDPVALGFLTPGGRPWTMRIGPSGTESHPTRPDEPLDAVVRGRAATLVRSFYKRDSLVRSAVGGMLIVGGRRPWRALRLPSILPSV